MSQDSPVDDFFQLLNTHRILVHGGRFTRHILLMFDDAHMLDDGQRDALTHELERHDQSTFASWMAARMRALSPPAVIFETTQPNREAFTPLRFHNWSSQRLESWLLEVGDRRVQRAQRDVSSFESCLSSSLEAEFTSSVLEQAAESERKGTYELAAPYGVLYSRWLEYWETRVAEMPPLDRAIRWAQLQIIMTRRIQNQQGEFVFEPLPTVHIENTRPDTLDMATMFMSERNSLPYFFGAQTVVQLASSNVDQFLSPIRCVV